MKTVPLYTNNSDLTNFFSLFSNQRVQGVRKVASDRGRTIRVQDIIIIRADVLIKGDSVLVIVLIILLQAQRAQK